MSNVILLEDPPVPQIALFGGSVAFSFTVWIVVARLYLWPALRGLSPLAAMRALLALHAFRFAGLSFIIPGVVSPALPAGFALPAAYGDFAAAILAVIALWLLPSRAGMVTAWVFNVWGTLDLLNAFFEGNRFGLVPGQLGASYVIVTVLVPLLLVTHGIMFALLVRRAPQAAAAPSDRLVPVAAGDFP
jgi:hypothetical protein